MNEMTYDPKKGLGPIDRLLLQGAGSRRSGKELSALVNGALSPEAAMLRVLEILDSRDWLSQAHQKMLLIDDMHRLKDRLMQQAVDFKDAGAAGPLINILNALGKVMAEDKIDLKEAMEQISRGHAQIMLDAISMALERAFLSLEMAHPELQRAELDAVFQEAFPAVVLEIESRATGD